MLSEPSSAVPKGPSVEAKHPAGEWKKSPSVGLIFFNAIRMTAGKAGPD